MTEGIDWNRRRFIGTAATALAAVGLDIGCMSEAAEGPPRALKAIAAEAVWINSSRLSSSALGGRVVLVDFCTYTCINWLRTLPWIRSWASTYANQLIVIGVHTPEFQVERDIANVRLAMQRLGVEHPVVIDNDYAIWRAFDNHYWPARYLFDARGRIRHRHFGEGEYEQTERAIQEALANTGLGSSGAASLVRPAGAELQADWANLKSGENYVGYDRTQNFASSGRSLNRRRNYQLPARLALNEWGLGGEWTMGKQATVLHSPNGRIRYRFHARDLHLVMGSADRSAAVRLRVSLDGQPPGIARGLDVDADGNGAVTEARLYQLLRQPAPIVDRQFEIEFLDAGVEALAFTFG